MTKKNVLLLEDEQDIREAVRALLSKQMPDVRFYESAEAIDAYHKCARQTFDLLILDIGLPRYSGYEVLQHLQEMPRHLRPKKVLVLSGHAVADEVKKHWNESFTILTKPCRSGDLREEVARLLGEAEPEIQKVS